MPITILDGPNNRDCCFFCGAMKNKEKGLCLAIFNQVDNIEYDVEIIPRYCPRCGKEVLSEEEYRKIWYEKYKENSRLFTINSEIATFDLIKAMNDSRERYWKKIKNDS